jgi:hypothetical protein
MVLVGIMVALTALHSFVLGPRQLDMMERGETGEEALRLRRATMAVSGVVLLASVIVIFLGALLNNHEWSFQQA